MEKGYFKKIVRKFAAAAIAATLGVSALSFNNTREKVKGLSDYSQVSYIADSLGVDTGVVAEGYKNSGDRKYTRLAPNVNEPIYVSFSDDYPKEEKEIATDALDYVFSILKSVNDNYYYKIVNEKHLVLSEHFLDYVVN